MLSNSSLQPQAQIASLLAKQTENLKFAARNFKNKNKEIEVLINELRDNTIPNIELPWKDLFHGFIMNFYLVSTRDGDYSSVFNIPNSENSLIVHGSLFYGIYENALLKQREVFTVHASREEWLDDDYDPARIITPATLWQYKDIEKMKSLGKIRLIYLYLYLRMKYPSVKGHQICNYLYNNIPQIIDIIGKPAGDLQGIQNQRLQCYSNTMLQLILRNNKLRTWYARTNNKDLRKVFRDRDNTNIGSLAEVCSASIMGQKIGQHDIFEYLLALNSTIQNGTENENNPMLVLYNQTNTTTNNNIHVEDIGLTLPLAPNDLSIDIQTLLYNYFEDTKTPDTNYVIKKQILSLPSVLLLNIKNSIWNNNIESVLKSKKKVIINNDISLSLINGDTVEYELQSFADHQGKTAKSGHYVAYIKESDGWYLYNDISVTNIDDNLVWKNNLVNISVAIAIYNRVKE